MSQPRSISRREAEGINELRSDHARVVIAIRALERAVGAPAPRRRREWLTNVSVALSQFQQDVAREGDHESAPSGVLELIREAEPRLSVEVDRIEEGYRSLSQRLRNLIHQLDTTADDQVDIASLRQEIGNILAEYRHLQAREVDLVYDAYNTDVGIGD